MWQEKGYKGKIIFDMDGVITGEERYWDAAALVVWELLYGERFLNLPMPVGLPSFKNELSPGEIALVRQVIFQNEQVIAFFKKKAVNSNWDLAFLTFSFHLVSLFNFLSAKLKDKNRKSRNWLPPGGVFSLKGLTFLSQLLLLEAKERILWSPNFKSILGDWAGSARGTRELAGKMAALLPGGFNGFMGDIFIPYAFFWGEVRDVFQEWYWGDEKGGERRGRKLAPNRKEGLIRREEPLLPPTKVAQVLTQLMNLGWNLGIATGRPWDELCIPLKRMGLWSFFDHNSVVTSDHVSKAEKDLGKDWKGVLSKPHPFPFLKAFWGDDYDLRELVSRQPVPRPGLCWVVGDSLADLLAAKQMGASFLGVLTGHGGVAGKDLFQKEGAEAVLPDLTYLPSFFK